MSRKDDDAALEIVDSWTLFRREVPAAERKLVANIIRDRDVSDVEGFTLMCKDIVAALFEGKIQPDIAKEARAWAEQMFLALTTAAGTSPEVAMVEQYRLVMEARKTQKITMKPQYTTPVEVIDAEPELIEAKAEGE